MTRQLMQMLLMQPILQLRRQQLRKLVVTQLLLLLLLLSLQRRCLLRKERPVCGRKTILLHDTSPVVGELALRRLS